MVDMSKIYSATYSNVPVYEYNANGNHVMRRRADDWINATHILKVADFDKPARTRILEREVQKGVHEKVQGGYGKYQGTWIPLHDGRALAERNGVLDKLLPIFDYVPGDRSPPPAPKHATNAAAKPKAPRQSGGRKAAGQAKVQPQPRPSDRFETASQRFSPELEDGDTIVSDSLMEDDDMMSNLQYTGSRKRKREAEVNELDRQHQLWADSLLDYFMLLDSDDRFSHAPDPPPSINIDRPIDEKGHTAIHWAAAMGDVEVVKDLKRKGARLDIASNNLETPLMRAVMFTNNFDKLTMPSMVQIFGQTVHKADWQGSTVFHHIANTTQSSSKYPCARYYMDCILNQLHETWNPDQIAQLLNRQDKNGDTAMLIAARNGARKCVRALLGRSADTQIANRHGETADDLIRNLNSRRQRNLTRQLSSSPFGQHEHRHTPNGNTRVNPLNLPGPPALAAPPQQQYRSQTASHLMSKIIPTFMEKCEALAAAYEAELIEKEREAIEAENVVKKRQAEIESIQRQIAEYEGLEESLRAADPSNGGPDGIEARQTEELERLVREATSLMEMEQRGTLRRQIAQAEQRAHTSSQSNATEDGAASLSDRYHLAVLLHKAQLERQALVQQNVQAQSVAGMGERTSEYKRLICGALNVREEDVEGMLPEILGELEEARERDVLDSGAGLGGGGVMGSGVMAAQMQGDAIV